MLVPLEADPARARWVLKVDVDAGYGAGGSGGQYFVGDFDGHSFRIDLALGGPGGETVDFGPDFYAAASWLELPPEQPGPLWVGWMSNHKTGRLYPTKPWRGAQSLPRTLFLFEEDGRLKLGQRPIASAAKLFDASQPEQIAHGQMAVAAGPTPGPFRAEVVLNVIDGRSETLELVAGDEALLALRYDQDRGLIFSRKQNGHVQDASFAFETCCDYPAGERLGVELFFDSCLVDVFVSGGRRMFSCCVFPTDPRAVAIHLR